MKHYPVVLLIVGLLSVACDSQRVFEVNNDFKSQVWHKDSIMIFKFEIEDPAIAYNIYYNIRNTSAYPYYNLYLNHELKNTIGTVLSSNLDELFLFDQKSGKPQGRGMGDVFDHQIMVLQDFRFSSKGTYQFSTQQYMRQEELPQLMAVGIRVERSQGVTN